MGIMTENVGNGESVVEVSSDYLLSNKPRHSLTLRTTHDIALI